MSFDRGQHLITTRTVIAVGGVFGHLSSLKILVEFCRKKWKKPYFCFMGPLTGGASDCEVCGLVTELIDQSSACLLRSKENLSYFGGKLLTQRDWLIFNSFFLSHAPIYKYPALNWIESTSLHDTLLSSFEQAFFARYDFAGLEVVGDFAKDALVKDSQFIGVCAPTDQDKAIVHPGHYIALGTKVSDDSILAALNLNFHELIKVHCKGLYVQTENLSSSVVRR